MSLFEIVLLSFPFAVDASVEKKIFPPVLVVESAAEFEPRIVDLLTVLLVAPLIKRIVEVPIVADAVVLEIVRLLPPAFKPSMVTLSAPLRSISGLPAVVAPVIVRAAPPAGDIAIDVTPAT